MKREMRRIKQLLPEDKTIEIMERNTAGVLALLDDDDYPYAVPVSYVYVEGEVFPIKNVYELKGNDYTKAAVVYKQAMDSTIYGLNRYSSMQQVLRAIPKSDKDYFLQFMQEKNKSKRRKILKYVSPYERKALQIAWGDDNIDKPKSNFSFFKDHKLPGVFWSGWTPQVDLEKVKIKTIENEGMLLSDFGYYDSESTEPSTINAPFIDEYNKGNSNTLTLQSKITTILNGAGLTGVKVTVEPTNRRGIQVISNITNSLKITEYKIQKELNKFTGARLFY